MNYFDLLIFVIISYGLIRGSFRGIIRELSSIFSVLCGFYIANYFYPNLNKLIAPIISNQPIQNFISFISIFCIVIIIFGIVTIILKYLFNIAFFGWYDRVFGGLIGFIIGGLIGFIKGFLVCCCVFIIFVSFLPNHIEFINRSKATSDIKIVSEKVIKLFPRNINEKYKNNIQTLKIIQRKNI